MSDDGLKDAIAEAIADARAITGDLGLRPRYRVCLVRVRHTGGEVGRGLELLESRLLEPPPRVEFRERRDLGPGGTVERGSVVLTEVAPIPASELTRWLTPHGPGEQVYVEIVLDEPDAPVRRYVLAEAPERRAFDWRLVLKAQGATAAPTRRR